MKVSTSQLTAAEMGKLWASYVGNTMGICTISYYLKHVEDSKIKGVLEHALRLSQQFSKEIKIMFEQSNFPIPVGFTDEDVNLDAPRLYFDDFYLFYLQYLGKAGMSIYSVAIPLVTNHSVRDFFVHCLQETTKLMGMVNDLLETKGELQNSPFVQPPDVVDFVNRQSFLNGFFGNVRTLHGLEVAHLYGCINNDCTSKALMLGFIQSVQNEKIKKFLKRGIHINKKHINHLSRKLTEDNIPAPSLIDHLVTKSTTPVFSEKMIVFHKIDMFSMKIREYANGASLNGRTDIGALYAKCQLDVSLYVEDGANIMIDHGWMEQPPLMTNRERLVHTN